MTIDLTEFQPVLKKQQETLYILDKIRYKYFVLTPEEWVRQGIIYFLEKRGFPTNLMQIERGIDYPNRIKRPDIIVYDRAGKPFLLIECKAPYIALEADTWGQALAYNSIVQAPYTAITNGSVMFILELQTQKIVENLPTYS
jgi:hypothetical protein